MSEIDVIKSELDALERAAIEPNLSLKDLLDIKKRIRRLRRKLNLILKMKVVNRYAETSSVLEN